MTTELPNLNDIEVVQLMAAQRVVMNHREELHDEYLKEVQEFGEEYGVEIPDHYSQSE